MPKILIVEDEKKQLAILKDYFESENYNIFSAEDGLSAVQKIISEQPDIVILDVMLPKKSGFDVCRQIREKGLKIPVIILTAKGEEIDRVMGLELGADDYVTKPFSLRELQARVRACLRRGADYVDINRDNQEYKLINKAVINFKEARVIRGKSSEKLSRLEITLLKYFIRNKNRIVSRDDIFDNVWGYDHIPESRTIDSHMVSLRKKIEKDYKNPEVILTVHGQGYKFVATP